MGCKNSNLKNATPPWIILPLTHLPCNWNSQGAKYFLFLTHLLNSHELTEWGYSPPALKVSLMTEGCLGFWLMQIFAFLYKMQKVETGRYTQIFLLPLRQIACFLLPLITFLFLILFLFFFFSSVNSLIPAIGTRSCFPFCGCMHLYLPFFLIDILVGGWEGLCQWLVARHHLKL